MLEQIDAIRALLGDRMLMLNGMPTAETYAQEFRSARLGDLFVGDLQFRAAHRDRISQGGA